MSPQAPPHDRADARPVRLHWWDIAVVGVIALLVVPSALSSIDWYRFGSSTPYLLAAAVFGALIVLYAVLGRQALRRGSRDEPPLARDFVFVALLALLVGFACAIRPSYATLQVLAYPMAWSILARYRDAVVASGVIATLVGSGSAVAYIRDGLEFGVETAVLTAALSFVFSIAMGTWITRIFTRGEEYRLMVEQLREAQSEAAALSLEAGAAAERERLSRELHDTLTQTLTGLVMLSEQATRALADDDADHAEDRLARVATAAREAVSEARALVATTHPLGEGGLEQALARVAHRLGEDSGLRVAVEFDAPRLGREQEVVLLRAAQEGLANVRKHARADDVTVRLYRQAASVVLEMEDDGVGMPGTYAVTVHEAGAPADRRASTNGFGLRGLADRVRLVGGDIDVSAGSERRGTRLTVRLPQDEWEVEGA